METIFAIKSTSERFSPFKLLLYLNAMVTRSSSFFQKEWPKDEWQMLTLVKQAWLTQNNPPHGS
jgi:hypothetical protein